jgi:hypothetical protein
MDLVNGRIFLDIPLKRVFPQVTPGGENIFSVGAAQ